MNYNSLSKDELIKKIEKLEHDLLQAKKINNSLANAEDIIMQQSSNLKFLNSIAIPLADKSTVYEFSKILLRDIQKHTGAVLATFSYYQSDKKELDLLHVEAEPNVLKTALKIAGEKITKTASPVDDDTYNLIIKNKVATYNTFTEVTFGAIPKIVDKAIRAATGIELLYPVAHVIEGELYGTTMLAFKKGQESPSLELLESYAYLMSVSLRRYNAEKALVESESKYKNLVEAASDAIYLISEDGIIIDTNQSALEISGKKREEIVEHPIDSVDPNYPVNEFLKFWKDVPLNKQVIFESTHQHKNGNQYPVELSAKKYKLGDKTYYYSVARDITERKLSEAKVIEKDIEFRKLSANVPDLIFQFTRKPDGSYYVPIASEGIKRIFGCTPEDVVDNFEPIARVIHPEDAERVINDIEYSAKHLNFFTCEFRVQIPGKQVQWIFSRSNPEKLADGSITWYGFNVNITERKKVEEELIKVKEEAERNENKYRSMFEAMQEGVYLHSVIYDDNGKAINYRIIEANTISEKYLNIKKKDAIGKLATELYGTEEAPLLEVYSKVAETGVPCTFDEFFEPLDKHFLISAFSAKKGEFATVFLDVTSQKQNEEELVKAKQKAEESELRFKAISEQAMDGIALTDLEGRYVFVNQAFCKMMGYSEQELLKLKVFDLRAEDAHNSLFESIKEDRKKGKSARTKLIRKDGSTIYVDLNGSFLDIGNEQYILGIHRDVSELVNREQELILAKEKAEESDRLKSAFLANMSHEIRTPMNGILGFTSLLKEPGLTGKQQKDYIEIIQKSGDRMLNTVNDIIEISRIETEQLKLTSNPVNVRDHLITLYNFFRLEAENKGLKLILDNKLSEAESFIKTDKSKFGSIVSNLIKNAIKFTDKGSITIGCKRKGEFLEFYVKDTGIGIPLNRTEAIFNRFEQADIADTRVFEGSGLGLSIAQSYAEMLGGEIWVESEQGVGSNFCFTLPFKTLNVEISEKNTEDSSKTQSLKKGLKILIAEDDETAITYLKILLKDYGKEMLIAKTGPEAVELCRKNPDIDIVLMDIKMPGLDGYKATGKIREFNKDVFIVAQTAYAQSGDREKAIEAGCDGYISKPINKLSLFELINKRF